MLVYGDAWLTVWRGDCRAVLAELESESVQTVVTSPPYWSLRDYGHEDQLGLEPTPELYVAGLVDVFRQIRRVLRADGTVWLNLGDCYATGAGAVGDHPGGGARGAGWRGPTTQPSRLKLDGLQRGDLVGIPWRVAFALQADGWLLRSEIIWSKPNPLPESVRDRPTRAHEYVFLLAKSRRYHFDAAAVAEPAVDGERYHGGYDPGRPDGTVDRNGRAREAGRTDTRNIRTVWTVPSQAYAGAHYATFPERLIEPMILGRRAGRWRGARPVRRLWHGRSGGESAITPRDPGRPGGRLHQAAARSRRPDAARSGCGGRIVKPRVTLTEDELMAAHAGGDPARATELDFRRQIIDLAQLFAWQHVGFRAAQTKHGWRTPGTGTMARGWPDLTLLKDGRLIFAELKSSTGRLDPEQIRVLGLLRRIPCAEVYVWKPTDLAEIVAILRAKP